MKSDDRMIFLDRVIDCSEVDHFEVQTESQKLTENPSLCYPKVKVVLKNGDFFFGTPIDLVGWVEDLKCRIGGKNDIQTN